MNIHFNFFLKNGVVNNIIICILNNKINKNISFAEIDFFVFYYLKIFKYKSSILNFNKFKFCICLSFDNIICHGIPIFEKIIFKIIKIDLSIKYLNHSDCCLVINKINKINFFLKNFFFNILRKIKIKFNYSYIGKIMKLNFIFEIIKQYCSHEIFFKLHKNIILHEFNYNKKNIKNFDSFTIEPMINFGNNYNYHYLNIFFSKKFFSFQWEHTIFMMNNKKIITTLRKSELCFLFQ